MLSVRLKQLMDELLTNLSNHHNSDYRPHFKSKFFTRPQSQRQKIFNRALLTKTCSSDVPRYDYALDLIKMPDISQYDNINAWIYDMLHELSHWTNHADRCPRLDISINYDREELVAELSAHIIAMYIGLEFDKKQSYNYIHSYLNYDVIPYSIVSDALIAAEYVIDQMAEGNIFEPEHNPLRPKRS